MAVKIFVGNYKGGVGKTVSTFNIGCLLNIMLNKSVLLMDLDPQSSLSEICLKNIDKNLYDLNDNEVLNYVFDVYMQGKQCNISNIKVDSTSLIKHSENVDFIPSDIFYSNGGLDSLAMKMATDDMNIVLLKQFIDDNDLDSKYDYILFDCPPSNNLITQSAFMVSDYYLIPTIMDNISTKGINHYVKIVDALYNKYCNSEQNKNAILMKLFFGDEPKLLGVFETMRKGNTNTNEYRSQIKDKYHLFESEVKHIKEIAEDAGKGIFNKVYEPIVVEIINRLNSI